MKLDRLALTGFVSHQATDWSPNGARLVALTGPNGAGKSSLVIDALLYALADDGRLPADDLVRIGDTDMSVVAEFVHAGSRYRVTRGRSIRGAGRSFLELAIADGAAWRPLTAGSIRETQEAIEHLLGMDPATLETAVVLRQGDADRFAVARPAERKRILGVILGLEVWERAEAAAKDRARTLDAGLTADRASRERLDQAIFLLHDSDEAAAAARATLERIGGDIARATQHRDEAQERLQALAVGLAEARAAAAEVERLGVGMQALKARWERTVERHREAERAKAAAERSLDGADALEQLAQSLPGLRKGLDVADATEAQHRGRTAELEHQRKAQRDAERAFEAKLTAWRTERSRLASRVSTLEDQIERAEPVTCPGCGMTIPATSDRIKADLVTAQAALHDHGHEPASKAEGRAASQIYLIEQKLEELAYDPEHHAQLRRLVTDAERAQASLAGLQAARDAVATAERGMAQALEEQEEIKAAVPAMRQARHEAQIRAQAAAGLEEQRMREDAVVAAARAALGALDGERAHAQAVVARAEAQVAERDRMLAERADLDARLAGDELELRRLRRLVEAFGPKGIPARITASALPEFEAHANGFLGAMRPGMSLSVHAQRARKSGDGVIDALDIRVRDDVGERLFDAYSGGERTSVSLALAVGLSRLAARRSGSPIRTFIVDEPDGLDEQARRAFGHALRELAHRGELERVVLITHTPDLPEYADEVHTVRKEGGRSVVEVGA